MNNTEPLRSNAIVIAGKLFASITAHLEDAHDISVMGHLPKTAEQMREALNDLQSELEEIAILSESIDILAQAKMSGNWEPG